MSGTARERLLDELSTVSRRYMASYALFNQALADRLNLHPTDMQCVNLLSLEGAPVTTGRIAQLTGLTTGSATRLVDRLEKAGYVVRRRDTVDRRRVLVATVPEKVAEFGRVWDRLGGGWYALFDELADDELALVIGHMRRTVELSAEQIARLRDGDLRDAGGDTPDVAGGSRDDPGDSHGVRGGRGAHDAHGAGGARGGSHGPLEDPSDAVSS